MDPKFFNLLGLASRAKKIVTGDMLLPAIQSKRVSLVLIASDASENTKKKYSDKCSYYGINFYSIEDSETLNRAIGKNNRMVIGVDDKGFAQKMFEYLK